jgi:hypothetical protein
MNTTKLVRFLIICLVLANTSCKEKTASDNTLGASAVQAKELFLPEKIWNVPENNDFSSDTSEFSFSRMKESENIALFWTKELGSDPLAHPDSSKRIDVDLLLQEGERIYNYFVHDLKFVEKGNSITDKYKALIFIIGGDEGTAYGGGADEKIGIFWAPPSRMLKPPFGAMAHEMVHSFQYLAGIDKFSKDSTSARGVGSYPFIEMTAQYMMWQVYPEWLTFENYHLKDYMKKTHLAFLHEKNMYHAAHVLEYWSGKHGIELIGNIYRESRKGEDPALTYMRLTGIDQATFNDELFDAYRRFITWDIKRIEKVASPHANQHSSELNPIGDGWYRIAESRCPQNYGYNGIRLVVPKAGTTVKLNFKGLAGAEGFNSIQAEKAGWRYGFVAVKENGSRKYSKVFSDPEGEASFKIPAKTKYLWLVVSGAPTEHWVHEVDWKDETDEQWPYQIKLTGTEVDESAILLTKN